MRNRKLNSDNPMLSVFMGLSGIAESASKECGAISLDLLLQSSVVVEGDDNQWDLAPDYSDRQM